MKTSRLFELLKEVLDKGVDPDVYAHDGLGTAGEVDDVLYMRSISHNKDVHVIKLNVGDWRR